jgi:uncharacterized protein YkwD
MTFRFRLGLLIFGLFALSGSSLAHKSLAVSDVLVQINRDRTDHGLAALKVDATLNLAALAKAQDMIDKNYFAHTSPQGTTPWHWFKAMGYNYSYAGENLAQGYSEVTELENSLMASPTHRANILSPFYSQVGLAVVEVGTSNVVVELFGSKGEQVSLRQ